MLESQIQSKIIKALEEQGYYVIKIIKCNKNGIPDLLAMKKNDVFFVEVKAKKGVTAELQKFRIGELYEKGFPTYEIRSLSELHEALLYHNR